MNEPPASADFWSAIDRLVSENQVVIDRPKGCIHPRYPGLIYPLDYGYLKGTIAKDGGGVDVWLGSIDPALPTAILVTVDLVKRDTEAKILLGCTEAEADIILELANDKGMRAQLIRRNGEGLAALMSRRSVRRFLTEPVPWAELDRLIAAAIQAPSAHNLQPWRFVVLTAPEHKHNLAEAMGKDFYQDLLKDGASRVEADQQVARSRQRIVEAPAVIVLCVDESVLNEYPDARRQEAERLMAVQSVAMAGENLLLAAHMIGLGGVWVCAPLFAPQTVVQALSLPESWRPQGLLLVGYPANRPEARGRKPIKDVVRYL